MTKPGKRGKPQPQAVKEAATAVATAVASKPEPEGTREAIRRRALLVFSVDPACPTVSDMQRHFPDIPLGTLQKWSAADDWLGHRALATQAMAKAVIERSAQARATAMISLLDEAKGLRARIKDELMLRDLQVVATDKLIGSFVKLAEFELASMDGITQLLASHPPPAQAPTAEVLPGAADPVVAVDPALTPEDYREIGLEIMRRRRANTTTAPQGTVATPATAPPSDPGAGAAGAAGGVPK